MDDSGGAGYIRAQRLDAQGASLWVSGGVDVRGYATSGASVQALTTDVTGRAVVVWADERSDIFGDLYAQRVEPRFGEWGKPEPVLNSVLDNPADQGGKVIVRWSKSERDVFSDPIISHYSIWRSTDASAAAAAATSGDESEAKIVSDPKDVGLHFAGAAVYTEKRRGAAAVYWEWVANQDAMYVPSYSYAAATRQDSVAGEPAVHYFKVLSHARYAPAYVWESADMGGYSVDNLAPAAPLLLTAQRVGSDVHLKWNRVRVPDLHGYSAYRATSTGVMPVPIKFLASSDDTVLVDASAPTSALYYIVTAHDVHANQSDPSNEAHVGATTGIANLPVPTVLTLQQNVPNPFTGETNLRIGLPTKSDITVEVYDVAGRLVARKTLPAMDAGWQSVAFDGRDDRGRLLASGVYFSKVTAAGATRTQKMVIQQ
jgi:hypothetical protein